LRLRFTMPGEVTEELLCGTLINDSRDCVFDRLYPERLSSSVSSSTVAKPCVLAHEAIFSALDVPLAAPEVEASRSF
jgi:hypothetical protein